MVSSKLSYVKPLIALLVVFTPKNPYLKYLSIWMVYDRCYSCTLRLIKQRQTVLTKMSKLRLHGLSWHSEDQGVLPLDPAGGCGWHSEDKGVQPLDPAGGTIPLAELDLEIFFLGGRK
ncbi:hypothetical protein L6452_04218 [Arctium lappa]|uniref:Uncharacterized protein n=1 Tax=Arctium lappa TaxID=4217 RepID=A0ACB9FQL3_ARCLA|nr:hypothetical protein L6452_04218 [Arctium lappa]